MADTFAHILTKNQAKALGVLFTESAKAKTRAEAYFQGVVDGIPVPDGVDYTFQLSEDATTVQCTPSAPPKGPELVK